MITLRLDAASGWPRVAAQHSLLCVTRLLATARAPASAVSRLFNLCPLATSAQAREAKWGMRHPLRPQRRMEGEACLHWA